MKLRDITKKYIREQYDLNSQRATKSISVCTGYVELPLGKMTPDHFIKQFAESLPAQTEYIEISMYGYNGGIEIETFTTKVERESDDDVVIRLQKELKANLKAKLDIEKEKAEYIRLKDKYGDKGSIQ